MTVAGATVQHAQHKKQPQQDDDVARAKEVVPDYSQCTADDAAQLTVGVQLLRNHIAQQKA